MIKSPIVRCLSGLMVRKLVLSRWQQIVQATPRRGCGQEAEEAPEPVECQLESVGGVAAQVDVLPGGGLAPC